MKVAIDKNTIDKIQDLTEFEYIYVYDNEPLDYLLKLGIICQNKALIDEVDINLSQYNIKCLKKANIDDEEWYKLPPKKDYKFAIIVPSCNNDHR